DPASGHDHPELARKVAHAGKLVRDLHDMSMGLRMVPLRGTCNKLVRLERASQMNGQVVVTVSDDGRGLQRDRILERAQTRGLVRPGEVLNDTDLLDLIFAPGLSTAQQVTDVSGRGVGMDVVRRNIQALHGRVDVESMPGQGTTITLRVP